MNRRIILAALSLFSIVLALNAVSAHMDYYDYYSYPSYQSYNVRYIDTHYYQPYPYTMRYFEHYSLENRYQRPFVHYIVSGDGMYYSKYVYPSTPYMYRYHAMDYGPEPVYYWPYDN
jgi:hypothetical protein